MNTFDDWINMGGSAEIRNTQKAASRGLVEYMNLVQVNELGSTKTKLERAQDYIREAKARHPEWHVQRIKDEKEAV